MNLTRRDLLRFAAGSAAGLLFTPIPWKLLDDSAIWTQNWPWIPEPTRGEAVQKFSACTLCGAGCGIRARCINGMPVSLAGIEGHPFGNGALCAAGLAAHHLAFHPLRARTPLRRSHSHGVLASSPIPLDQAIADVVNASGPGKCVAVLDRRPGRMISRRYRTWLASLPDGRYLVPPPTEAGTLEEVRRCVDGSPEFGYDFEHASCIVSFGTPLFDGWGSPGRMMRLLDAKRRTDSPTVVQIEHRFSRTAMHADMWVPAFPGTETTLALSLLAILCTDGLTTDAAKGAVSTVLAGGSTAEMLSMLQSYSPEKVSEEIGVPSDTIVSLARTMASRLPTIVLAGGDAGAGPCERSLQTAVTALNLALGSVNAPGGILRRSTPPWDTPAERNLAPSTPLNAVADGSIDVLILDNAEDGCSIPWKMAERKLRDDHSLVVSLSPFIAGLARHADLIIPSPAPLEQWEEIPTPPDASQTSFAIAAPLMTAPEGTTNAADVIRRLSLGTGAGIDGAAMPDALKERVNAICEQKRGVVLCGSTPTPVKDLASADDMMGRLAEGGVWLDDAATDKVVLRRGTEPLRLNLRPFVDPRLARARAGRGADVVLVPTGVKGCTATGQVSPLLSKVFQESTLRPSGFHLFLNPETCEGAGLKDGDKAGIQTASGSAVATVHTDKAVMPGVAVYAVGPDPEAINQAPAPAGSLLACCVDNQDGWRATPATLGRA